MWSLQVRQLLHEWRHLWLWWSQEQKTVQVSTLNFLQPTVYLIITYRIIVSWMWAARLKRALLYAGRFRSHFIAFPLCQTMSHCWRALVLWSRIYRAWWCFQNDLKDFFWCSTQGSYILSDDVYLKDSVLPTAAIS